MTSHAAAAHLDAAGRRAANPWTVMVFPFYEAAGALLLRTRRKRRLRRDTVPRYRSAPLFCDGAKYQRPSTLTNSTVSSPALAVARSPSIL
jgi:hypothetical protein